MHDHGFDNTYKCMSMICRYLHMNDHDFVDTYTYMTMVLTIPTHAWPWFVDTFTWMTMILLIPSHAWPWFWQYLQKHDHDFDNTYTCMSMIMIDTYTCMFMICGYLHMHDHDFDNTYTCISMIYRYLHMHVNDFDNTYTCMSMILTIPTHARPWLWSILCRRFWPDGAARKWASPECSRGPRATAIRPPTQQQEHRQSQTTHTGMCGGLWCQIFIFKSWVCKCMVRNETHNNCLQCIEICPLDNAFQRPHAMEF